jgi:hypothetical protein
MEQRRRITGTSTNEVWNDIHNDFNSGESLHDYHVVVNANKHDVELDIVSSPGGSAEGGYDTTRLTTHLEGNRVFISLYILKTFCIRSVSCLAWKTSRQATLNSIRM